MRWIQSAIIAFSMYSKIPMPMIEWNEKNMKYAMCFFPMIGGTIGLLEVLIGSLLKNAEFGDFFVAAVMTLIPVMISGGIHLDGYMDTLDALASYGSKEKKLEILKDSHNGAFAVIGLSCYFIWSLAVWCEMPRDAVWDVAPVFVLSRALSGFSVVSFKAAKESGLLRTFQDGAKKNIVKVVLILYYIGAILYLARRSAGIAGLLTGISLFVLFCYHHIAKKQFGGVTGDLAGWFLQVCELSLLTGIMLWYKWI